MSLLCALRGPTLPIIHQTEATECGLACLAMLARYHGHDIDLGALRARFSISLKGADLSSLMRISDALSLSPRALALDIEHLPQLKLPALLHWDMNHFVVLKSVSKTHAIIHDPASGARKLSLSEFGNHFTGVALELSPRADFAVISGTQPARLSMLWSKLTGLKRAAFQTLVLSLLFQGLILASPFYLQFVIDGALPQSDKALLLALALGFGALTILRSISEAVRAWAILIYGQQMSLQMVGNVFAHLVRLPISYFEKRHIGDVISRINSTQPIQIALTRDVVAVFIDGVMAIFTLIVMYMFSPLLTGIVLLSAALTLIMTLTLYPKLRAAQEETITRSASENSYVIETLRAATTVKLFGREAQRESSWRNLFARYVNSSTHYGQLMILQNFMQGLIAGLQLIAIVYFGALTVMSAGSSFTLGMLFAFMMYRQLFSASLMTLMEKLIEFRLLGLHIGRLADIVQTPREAAAPIQAQNLARTFRGNIEIKNLFFRYSPMDPWVLNDISLKIPAGEMVVITGKSGGGKTTLMKLILGLYQPQSGQILMDGQPLEQTDMQALRESIGVVMQDDTLMSGTLADNISFFDAAMDIDKVRDAAKKARIDDDIMAMPMTYHSMVGDMGSILSGGQRQRILLARALYKNPTLLFLDEGTANLDTQTEKDIADVIESMKITRIIVAHRPEFITRATQKVDI